MYQTFIGYKTMSLLSEAPETTEITEPTEPTEPTENQDNWIPEKHQVKLEDGSLDIEASSKKVAEAYKHLERKLGSGDVPPKTPEEYVPKVEGIEGFDWEAMKSDEKMQGFLKGAHSKGLTNDQVSYVIGEYLARAPELITGAKELSRDELVSDLSQSWTTQDELSKNLQFASKAFRTFADKQDLARIDEIGNNPIVLRMLAKIGKEISEDKARTAPPEQIVDFETRAYELRQQLLETPTSDKRRAGLQAQLDALYTERYKK